MNKRVKTKCRCYLLLLLASAVSVLSFVSVSHAEKVIGKSVTSWPAGVTVYDPQKAYNGFTLFVSLKGDGTHYLINNLNWQHSGQ